MTQAESPATNLNENSGMPGLGVIWAPRPAALRALGPYPCLGTGNLSGVEAVSS